MNSRTMLPCLACLCLLASACSATTQHRVAIAPIHSQTPVSMSGYYLENGTIVTPDDYRVVGKISIEKKFEAPIGDSTVQTVDISPLIEEQVARAKAHAVVNVTAQADQFDGGATSTVRLMNSLGTGWLVGGLVVGAGGVGVSQISDESKSGGYIMVGAGAALAVVGTILLISASSKKHHSKSEWQFRLDGDAVQPMH
jgi:hypothetical protein